MGTTRPPTSTVGGVQSSIGDREAGSVMRACGRGMLDVPTREFTVANSCVLCRSLACADKWFSHLALVYGPTSACTVSRKGAARGMEEKLFDAHMEVV